MRSSGKYPLKRVSFCLVFSSALVHLANFQLSYHKFKIDFHFNMADRRLRRHLSQDEMNRGIGMLHSGLSQRHVANVLGVSQSVVSRMWNRFITTGNVRHLHAGGGENAQPIKFKTDFWWFRHGATDLTTQQRYVGTSRTLQVCG